MAPGIENNLHNQIAPIRSDLMKRTQEVTLLLLEFAVFLVIDRPSLFSEAGRDHAPVAIANHEDDVIDRARRPAVGEFLSLFFLERFHLNAMEMGAV
ncbi:hypothetical protein [Rhodopirellula islandica]|uniref:hypothetical protein n=1 Tax=Rhodopirellula islandica TaxID=595434 RepID=UPI001F16B2A7|nr:hypothetical protein [Rhodopirellula islandica]